MEWKPNVNGANNSDLSYASYVTPDKIIASASYRLEYFKIGATSLSMVYEGGSQGRFSYIYSANTVRDGGGNFNLIYVPKDASEITFVPQTVNSVPGQPRSRVMHSLHISIRINT
jgi:hypothetical protein